MGSELLSAVFPVGSKLATGLVRLRISRGVQWRCWDVVR